MDQAVCDYVRRRAGNRCEYCRLPQLALPFTTFHIEHIVARQHLGSDEPANLCLACSRCNFLKGTNLSTTDFTTGQIVLLFHPRQDAWDIHFRLEGPEIIGLTPIGRGTVRLLQMNADHRLRLRGELLASGKYDD